MNKKLRLLSNAEFDPPPSCSGGHVTGKVVVDASAAGEDLEQVTLRIPEMGHEEVLTCTDMGGGVYSCPFDVEVEEAPLTVEAEAIITRENATIEISETINECT